MKYRKKPIIIDAWQNWTGDPEIDGGPGLATARPEWVDDRVQPSAYVVGGLVVATLEGQMMCQPGDWLIRGVAGELYPCRADIFAATYEPADAARGE